MNKMVTRVRYKKQENGWLESNEFLAKEDIVRVIIEPDAMVVRILNKDGALLHRKEGDMNTLTHAKNHAKSQLRALGVNFHEEFRTKVSVTEEVINNEEKGEN